MHKNKRDRTMDRCIIDISDKDIYQAMKDIPGYLDITPQDLKEVYRHAYQHAVERLTGSVKAKDVMTEKVVFVSPETPLYEVAEVMAKHGISGVPVVDSERVVGVISDKDFLSHIGTKGTKTFMGLLAECLGGSECATESLQAKVAREIMIFPVITVDEDTPLVEIADMFTAKHINRAPVLNREGNMVGIVTRDDIVRASFGGTCGVL